MKNRTRLILSKAQAGCKNSLSSLSGFDYSSSIGSTWPQVVDLEQNRQLIVTLEKNGVSRLDNECLNYDWLDSGWLVLTARIK